MVYHLGRRGAGEKFSAAGGIFKLALASFDIGGLLYAFVEAYMAFKPGKSVLFVKIE